MNINFLGRNPREWLSSLPVFIILLGVLVLSIGENLNSQLNKLGNHIWPDYHTLRLDVPVPSCDPNIDIESEVQKIRISQRFSVRLDLSITGNIAITGIPRSATNLAFSNNKSIESLLTPGMDGICID